MDGAGIDLWDSEDEFFYDVILLPSGQSTPLKIHSMVGLVPLFAVFVASPQRGAGLGRLQELGEVVCGKSARSAEERCAGTGVRAEWNANPGDPVHRSAHGRAAAHARSGGVSLRLRHSLRCRAITRASVSSSRPDGQEFEVKYTPAESDSRLFGGNSNWRGPIWFPVNYTIIRSLHEFSRPTTATVSRSSAPPAPAIWCTLGRSRSGARAAADEHLPARPGPRRSAGGLGRQRVFSDRSALARLRAVLRVFQRRHGRGRRREPSNRLDGAGGFAAVRIWEQDGRA